MSNVIAFTQSPLTPFLGKWVRDPLSVSRNKVVKHVLGGDGLKKLWACASIEEQAQCLAQDSNLAEKYQALLHIAAKGGESHVVVTLLTLTFNSAIAPVAKSSVYQVVKATAEGRKIIVESIDLSPARQGRRIGHVLRMNKQWLLVSERYYGAQARLFPRSPVFRYYRPS